MSLYIWSWTYFSCLAFFQQMSFSCLALSLSCHVLSCLVMSWSCLALSCLQGCLLFKRFLSCPVLSSRMSCFQKGCCARRALVRAPESFAKNTRSPLSRFTKVKNLQPTTNQHQSKFKCKEELSPVCRGVIVPCRAARRVRTGKNCS